ncbi:MAG: amidohydrolase family protein, partial [Dehalococcoidia bacterium]|nr:amidohydrolase family protein [Dehalococcoidia bacterium]
MLILHHANVITLDPARPRSELVACQDGRIVAVGGNDMLSQYRERGASLIDCQGQTVTPGFNDAHCHVLGLARSLSSLDCSPSSVRSISDIKNRLRERAQTTPNGTWIECNGYNQFYLAEGRHPNRHDLDEATRDHPVKLNHFSGHTSVLNSTGLELAGIHGATPEPPGGVIERELDTGLPNGLLHEMNYVVDSLIPSPSYEQLRKEVADADRRYLSLGVTSVQDATADN